MTNSLVSLASFKKLHVAAFIKEKLITDGIECFLTDEGFETNKEHAPKGFKLKVHASDTEAAVKVLLKVHKEYDIDKIRKESEIKDKKKILVPVDLGNHAMNIFEYAFGIAAKTGAEVKILHVYKDPTQHGPIKHTTSWEKHEKIDLYEAHNEAQNQLLKFREKLRSHINTDIIRKTKLHFSLLRGRPDTVIASVCKRYKPDLVVMGPKSKDEKKSAFIGSVTTSVIEHTKYPVLTIPKTAKFKGLDLINIMYATDFFEADNTSLNKLLDIVSPYQTKIHCIHLDVNSDPLKQAKVDELNEVLAREYSSQSIKCKLLESTDIIKGFDNFIKENNIDLLSFSSPRRTLFYKIFHENTLKKLVTSSMVPMLIFPV